MAKAKVQTIRFADNQFLKYSFIFGVCYWAMEAVRDVITFGKGTITERLLTPDSNAVWMRILVICVILLFGAVSDMLRERRKLPLWRMLFQSDWGLILVACTFSAFYWFFEAFRDFYVLGNGSFMEMAFSPSPLFLWMRLMAIFFLILFGLFVQINVNDLRNEEHLMKKEHLRLESLLQSRAVELREAKSLIRRLHQEIEKRKWLEAENLKIQEHLIKAQKVETIGVVAGGIAHDFNNLMTAVLGVSTLAIKDIAKDSTLYNDLFEIKVAAGRAADLTRQLLLLGHDHPIKFTPVDLNTTIYDIQSILTSLTGEDIVLNYRIEESLGTISGDKALLEQMIINLVVNGRDAIHRGGEISIQTRNVHIPPKTNSRYPKGKPGDYICLTVSDNGAGMPRHIQEKIFEPFFTTKAPGSGTGLGLSVVDQIVKKHQGWIHLESFPGRGTMFSVFLPLIASQVNNKDERDAFSENRQQGQGKRILLVEDEEVVREFTRRALGKQGYTVISAECAEEAKRLFNRDRGSFDLVLSDVVLPDESGVDLVLDFKNEYPDLAVLLCSGHSDSKSQWSEIQKHKIPFLKKPFEVNDLLKGVQEVI